MKVLLFLFLVLQTASNARAEIIDKIVAVVEGHIITLSDIRAERLMRDVLGEPTPQNDREILDELIDQHLIHPQLDAFFNVDPSEEELNARMAEIKDRKGLSESAIRAALKEHMHTQRFFQERFGQFTGATPEEIMTYYNEVFVPAAKERGLNPIPPLKEVEDAIRDNVIQEKTAKQVEAWLQQSRKTSKVEILHRP